MRSLPSRLMPPRFLLTYLIRALILLPSLSAGALIHVYPDGSGDYPTIAEGLMAAAWWDTVVLGDGVFYEHDLQHPTRVSIHSESGDPELTIIDAEFLGRCLQGVSVTGAPTVRGITFRNGVVGDRGGLLHTGDVNARFYDCIFENGSAPLGGAVAVTAPNWGHHPRFTRCRFESNTAGDGGAVWSTGTGGFDECTFSGNSASGHGGGIYSNKDAARGPLVRDSLFESNAAGGDGGGVYSEGESYPYGTEFWDVSFVSNVATRGGAARLEQYDYAYNSTFFDNEATADGGALYLKNSIDDKDNNYFTYNVFARNRAGERGGAIAVTGTTPLVQIGWSTFSDNRAPAGAHLWSEVFAEWGGLYASILSYGLDGAAVEGSGGIESWCSDVFANEGGDYIGPLLGQIGVNGNISEDPLFCNRHGGNYHLATGSPCLPPLPAGCYNDVMGRYGWGCDEVSSVEDSVPEDAILQIQVSPSPGAGEVSVYFAGPVESGARVAIHDVQGRVVSVLGTLTGETRQLSWDGRDARGREVGSGIYFVTATTADGRTASTQFLRLR